MTLARSLSTCALALAACATLLPAAQEEKTRPAPPPERKAQPRGRTAPAEQRNAPREQRTERPAVQQRAPQQPRREAPPQPELRTPPRERNVPRQFPQGQRDSQPAPAIQPGRSFGRAAERAPERPRVSTTNNGDVIRRDSNGQVREVKMRNGAVVYHPPNAPRRVEMVQSGGRVVVARAPGHGYVQRPVVVNNTTVIKRTYLYNGVPHARIYRPQVYRGVNLVVYTPVRYYRPAFYGYVYNPWPRPVYYSWGWNASPWYGYYGGYFRPYPAYSSPALWLTDFLIAATLEAAYQERMDARYAAQQSVYVDPYQDAPLTPEVKQAIAEEVRRQIDRERSQPQDGGQNESIFADNVSHVFVVNAALAVQSNYGECTIAEGDVLQMTGPPRDDSDYADLVVLASRGRNCRKGSTVEVGLQDLQEMNNQMRATLDRGLGDLQTRQGQDGLPPLPQGAAGTTDSPFAQAAQPDPNAATELTAASREADRTEQQAVNSNAPPTLTLGMTLDEVAAVQGNPQKIVDLGAKKIYVYADLKITFTEGKVTDIQ